MAFTSTSMLISAILLLASFTSKVAGQTCSFCADGGELAFPDKALPSPIDNLNITTCGEFYQLILAIPEPQCSISLAEIESGGIVASWCGCAGTEIPDVCFLCGPDEEISDPDTIIPDANGLTCGAGAEFARYIVNETRCEIEVKPNHDLCCRPKPVPTSAPTESSAAPASNPTAGPTESSAPASKFALPLTLCMLMVGTMMMMVLV